MTNIKSLNSKLEFTKKKKAKETKLKLIQTVDNINQKTTDLITLILNGKKRLIDQIKQIENSISKQLNEISFSLREPDNNVKDTDLNEQDLELLIVNALSFKSDLEAKINKVNAIENNFEFEMARSASEWNGQIGNIAIKDFSVSNIKFILICFYIRGYH